MEEEVVVVAGGFGGGVSMVRWRAAAWGAKGDRAWAGASSRGGATAMGGWGGDLADRRGGTHILVSGRGWR
jgi:hypothetical protein